LRQSGIRGGQRRDHRADRDRQSSHGGNVVITPAARKSITCATPGRASPKGRLRP
jgi:hypothetical protein